MKDRSYINLDTAITAERAMFKDAIEVFSGILREYFQEAEEETGHDEL